MAALSLKLRPFTVPNFVLAQAPASIRQDGFKESPSFPLLELTPETLSALCDEFRRGVFAKAGKKDPLRSVFVPAEEIGGYRTGRETLIRLYAEGDWSRADIEALSNQILLGLTLGAYDTETPNE